MKMKQVLKYATILFTGISISLYLYFAINDKYVQRNKATIENATSKVTLRLSEEINKINLVLESLSFFFKNEQNVSPQLFEQFTNPFLKQLNGIGALEWVPKVLNSTKQQYINKVKEDLGLQIVIKELDSANNFVVSGQRDIYFPIALINPLGPLGAALGYDLYSDSTRKSSIDATIRTKQASFSGPIDLVQKTKTEPGFLAMKAVFNPVTKEVKGIVEAVYRTDEFVEKTLSSELKILNIDIYDKNTGGSLMYSNIPDANEKNTKFRKNTTPIEIKMTNHLWEVSLTPKPKYISYPHANESYIAAFLTLLATALILSLVRRHDHYNRRLEAKVRLRTAELEESNEMKENLLREIHHRVKNNLQITSSLMNMQKRKLSSKEAITALEDSQARISAIALTHQKIYQDRDSKAVNLEGYLADLMVSQKRILSSLDYRIDCPDISIDLDRAVPLALIVSELVTNAVKHAYRDGSKSNELHITVKDLGDGEVMLTVYDNGKGLPENFDINKADGIGFEIIRSLCRQIAANLSYDSDGTGSSFRLTFKNTIKSIVTS